MFTLTTLKHFHPCVTVLLWLLTTHVHADIFGSLDFGFGPDGYRAYALTIDKDISNSAKLNLDHFVAKSANVDDLRQSGIEISWDATKLVSTRYHYSKISDGMFDVTGNEPGLSFALNELWQSDLRTTIGVGYGDFKYTPSTHRTNITNTQSLTQNKNTLSLIQNITPSFAVYGSHDQYNYDRNVAGLALLLIRLPRNTSKGAFTLLGFPDKTNTLGITWMPLENLNLDLASGKTITLLEQQQRNTKLGLDYQFNEKLNLIASVSRSNSTAIIRPKGATAQAATKDTYSELGAGWAF